MGRVVNGLAETSEMLLQGATTYAVSAQAWPGRTGDAFAEWINAAPKLVVSDSLTEDDIVWQPTTIIRRDDLIREVGALRNRPGGDIYVHGSLTVARALLTARLVDELVLFVEPITLGGGKRLFPDDGVAREFDLVSLERTSTGVLVCRYVPRERA